jgi:hypothetical protein
VQQFDPFRGTGKSSGGLYNDQIEKMMEKCPNFLGVYASDEIPKMMRFVHPNTKFGWISNLDSSKGKGSHWVSIVVNGMSQQPDPYSILYFDPFGEAIIPNIQKDLRLVAEKVAPQTMMKLKENKVKHQAEEDKSANPTTTCGWHAMHFINDILIRGKSFAEASGFKDMIDDKSGKYEKQIEEIKHNQKGLGFDYINLMGGDGIIDKIQEYWERIKQFIKGRKPGSPEVDRFVQSHGGEVIKKITICREPLGSMVKRQLNKVTKDMNYDKLFHLFITFETNSGSYRTERNEIVRVYKGGVGGETMNVPMNKQVTVAEFFGNVIKKEGDALWSYNAVKNNCQDYVLSILGASGLLPSNARSFVKQDIPALFKKLPGYTEAIAKGVTDFAARLRVLAGMGLKTKRDKKSIK